MTCIAWDGETLSADKQITWGNKIVFHNKIVKHNEYVLACTGEMPTTNKTIRWFKEGAIVSKFPKGSDDAIQTNIMVVVDPVNGLRVYQGDGEPVYTPGWQPWAVGSGEEYAITAMECGKTSKQAVAMAIKHTASCGGGITTTRIKRDIPKKVKK